ncbi:MAG TPA: tRNA (adenosine(37)-N6)-threonylcarbamoyltransferase complex dimerization subunit type 1 TsaB [Anaerolineaceae bacterium]|nr:tRNA (adenosine(37)-N6)-threonylcarbamoyltransferase complex dimerization subunit type 1 TsaB [Anaerolineaceae bacterium]
MLLAVDTSTQTMGLALYNGTQVLAESVWLTHSHHTVELAPAIDELFQRAAIKPGQLEAVACALGPGSFTSLRIGLAVVKGLALSLHIPVIGIPTLTYLAAAQPLMQMPMLAVLPAGRGRMAVSRYTVQDGAWRSEGELSIMTAEAISDSIHEPTYICGEMDAAERQQLSRKWKNAIVASPAQSLRRPSFLAELAWKRWQEGDVDEPVSLAPIYVHVAEAIPD